MSIEDTGPDAELSADEAEEATRTLDVDVRDVAVVEDNVIVVLERDSWDDPRNIICLGPDGTQRWRVGDHEKLDSPFQSVTVDYDVQQGEYVLYGINWSREFQIDLKTGDLEFSAPAR